jgi:hypothetical protein
MKRRHRRTIKSFREKEEPLPGEEEGRSSVRVVSDRCELSPIAAMGVDDTMDDVYVDSYAAVTDTRRGNPEPPRLVHYSTEQAELPKWMKDPTLLPKRPPGGSR